MADRAVSEVMSFVLVFSLVVASMALVSVAGFDALEASREAEQLNNAEQAFSVLSENLADIHQRGAPSRATEVSLERARMFTDDNVTVNVTGTFAANGSVQTSEATVRPLVFDGGNGRQIVYEGGAVFRTNRDGGVVLNRPPFVSDADDFLVPVVATQSPAQESAGGSTVLVRTGHRNTRTDISVPPGTYDNLYVNVTSPRRDVWERYLSSTRFSNCRTGTDADGEPFVTCDLGSAPDRVTVVVYEIDMLIER